MRTVDIAMATYNGEHYIETQIESIINQTFSNWRLFIRDDNSTDNTQSIIEEFCKKDDRIIFIKDNLGSLGVSRNFEETIKYCNSPYIMLADQDDYWFKNKIERSLDGILEIEEKKTSSHPILLFSNSIYTDECLNPINKCLYPQNLKTDLYNFLFINAGYQGAGMIFNFALKKIIIPFNPNLIVHDLHISMIAYFYGTVSFLPESLMYYRRHPSSTSKSNIYIKDRILSIINQKTTVFNLQMYNYVCNLYRQHCINLDEKVKLIMEQYFDIINTRCRFIKVYKCIRYKFKLRDSTLYLSLKLLFSPNTLKR